MNTEQASKETGKKTGRPGGKYAGMPAMRTSYSVPEVLTEGTKKFCDLIGNNTINALIVAISEHPEEFAQALAPLLPKYLPPKAPAKPKVDRVAAAAERLRGKFTAEELAAIAAQLAK